MRSRRHWVLAAVVAGWGISAPLAQATWIGASSGNTNDSVHLYTNTSNWAGGTIDDTFASSFTFTAPTTLYFAPIGR